MSLRQKRTTGLGGNARTTGRIAAYAAAVMSDAPTFYWKLDESSGTTAKDSSGNGSDGTYSGGFTLGSLTSNIGKACKFDGTNGTMATATGTGIGAWRFTLECWANFQAISSTSNQGHPIIAPKYLGGSSQSLSMVLGYNINQPSSVQKLQSGIFNGTSWSVASDTVAPRTLNTWYHLVATYDGTTLLFYVNGSQVGSVAVSIPATTNRNDIQPFRLAQNWDSSNTENFTAVTMQHVAIYTHALSAARITAHYQLGA